MINRRTIFIIALLAVILSALCFAPGLIGRIGKAKITISNPPPNSLVKINGQEIKTDDVYLKPGKYVVSITSDEHYEYRKIIDVSDKDETISPTLVKKPEKSIYTMVYSGSYEEIIKKYPIVKKLPYNTFLIDINYSPDSTMDSFTLVIDAREGYRSSAINIIESWGYNPAEYNIKYNNHVNPFAL
jgi:hypothetical protein